MQLQAHHPKARILIIDDAEDSIRLLTRILELAGFSEIHSTTDPRKAQGLYASIRPHAVLLDLHMPEMNGFQVIEQIRSLDTSAYAPILMLTSDNDRDTKLQALENGAKEFLGKPFDRLEVVARINAITEASHLHERLHEKNRSLQREVRERSRELQLETRNRIQVEEHARHLSLHDELTGLANRTLLLDRLQQCIYLAERAQKCVGVLLVNLNRFQEVNNTLGHEQGDALLQRVGERLSETLRHGDAVARIEEPGAPNTLARLAGDEFALVLPMLSTMSDAQAISQRALQLFNTPFVIGELSLDISVCLSVAFYPEHGEDPQLLLQRAEVAMYTAKKEQDGLVCYSPEQDHFSATRLTLMSELREAISSNTLELYYQPKVDLVTGKVTGFEALVRWMHEEHGFIPPDEFIPMAEETGMMIQLTRWVFRQAAEQCSRFASEGYEIGVAVNLSANDLMYKGLADEVAEVLETLSLPPELITLEVTESAMMQDPEQAQRTITRISETGVKFSIDDFGTGYSSLAYLKKLPVNEIKIDKSFVRDMEEDSDDAMIVHSTIDLAHNLSLKVVAEGVENGTIIELLKRLGCDTAQGYYLARPMPAEDIPGWLQESPWGQASRSAQTSQKKKGLADTG